MEIAVFPSTPRNVIFPEIPCNCPATYQVGIESGIAIADDDYDDDDIFDRNLSKSETLSMSLV